MDNAVWVWLGAWLGGIVCSHAICFVCLFFSHAFACVDVRGDEVVSILVAHLSPWNFVGQL